MLARRNAREIARLLGFDQQDQTRIATAISELARHAFESGEGGTVEYLVDSGGGRGDLVVRVVERGSGAPESEADPDRHGRAQKRTGLGIPAARRLMDGLEMSSTPGEGSEVIVKKAIPRWGDHVDLELIRDLIENEPREGAVSELRRQNQELVLALDALRARQEELDRLNAELAVSNRGVVALYAELDERVNELKHANEAKSTFLSGVSHELRTPLTATLALVDVLLSGQDGELGDEQREQVLLIQKASQDLLVLVNELLDLGKIEAGRLELELSLVEIAGLFSSLQGMLGAFPRRSGVELRFERPRRAPSIHTDEAKLTRILSNLITNALKFTEEGSVRVSASSRSDEIVFSVADTGIGIAPEDQERIFEEFVRLPDASGKKTKGSGLGLALSRRLALFLGGRLTVRSKPGEGSTFELALPVLGPGAPPDRRAAAPDRRATAPENERARIDR